MAEIAEEIRSLEAAIEREISNLIFEGDQDDRRTFGANANTLVDSLVATALIVVDTVEAQNQSIIDDVLAGFDDLFTAIDDSVVSPIINAGSAALGTIDRLIADLDRIIVDGFFGVLDQIDAMLAAIETTIDTVIDQITAIVSPILNAVGVLIDDLMFEVEGVVTTTLNIVGDAAFSVVADVQSLVGGFNDLVVSTFNVLVTDLLELTNAIERAIETSVAAVIESVSDQIAVLVDPVADVARSIATSGDQLAQNFEGLLFETIPNALGNPLATLQSLISSTLPDDPASVTAIMADLQSLRDVEQLDFDTLAPRLEALGQLHPLLQFVLRSFLLAWGTLSFVSGAASIQFQPKLQAFQAQNRWQIPDLALAVESWFRGHIDDEQFATIGALNGFTEETMELARRVRQNIQPPGVIQQWFNRGLVDRETALRMLTEAGHSADDAEGYLETARLIPPPQDLITMAVRDVFSPEIAERFGQFEGFPEAFAEHADRQGIDREWAERYWAAHWRLPSAIQGFEMLHRGVINDNDLDLLLRALDVMPFWRDNLRAISFNPLTRVDVRRMHALGVLDREEVKRAYLDLGYNDTNAERMTVFTELFNADDDDEDEGSLKDLSQSAIMRAFDRGVFDEGQARAQLAQAGFSPQAVDVLVDTAVVQRDLREREDLANLIFERFDAGLLTVSQAQDAIDGSGLSPIERERMHLELQHRQAAKTRLPSRADLDRFLRDEVISPSEYVEHLLTLGYSDLWAQRFLRSRMG